MQRVSALQSYAWTNIIKKLVTLAKTAKQLEVNVS